MKNVNAGREDAARVRVAVRRLLLVPSLLLAATQIGAAQDGSQTSSDSASLKVMTFNIHNYENGFWYVETYLGIPVITVGQPPPPAKRDYETISGRQGYSRAMGSRVKRILQIIEGENPAIVGLQEAYMDQVHVFTKLVPRYKYIGRGRETNSRKESVSILYDTSRVRLVMHSTSFGSLPEAGHFWFSADPSEEGSKSGGDAWGWGSWADRGIARICTWGRFRQVATDKTFYVFNLHLQHDLGAADAATHRRKSVLLLLDRIKDRRVPDPVIAMGDFNATQDETPIRLMTGSRMKFDLPAQQSYIWTNPHPMFDAYRVRHGTASGGTKCQTVLERFIPRADVGGRRIDYIFVSPAIEVLSADRMTQFPNNVCPSDHVPVVAQLRLH